jgi:flavodoxin
MKKLHVILIIFISLFSLTACKKENTPPADSSPVVSEDTKESAKVLVVYFSMPETADPNNMTQEEENSTVVINNEVLGNTQYVAYLIQKNLGADIFRIEPEVPYPVDHSTLVDLAKKEQNEKARPKLAKNVENIEQYDIIFIGYPNWWGDMPMILYTFLEENDLSGKTIIPFNTHGGSGFSGTISTISGLQPNSTVYKDGFSVSRNAVEDCENDVSAWLNTLNINNK